MRIVTWRTAEQLAAAAADFVVQRVAARPDLVLALPTGETPRLLYAQLRVRAADGRLDASRLRAVNLDEYRGVAPHVPRSFRRALREALLDPLGIPESRHLAFDGLQPDGEAAARAVSAQLAAWGGIDLAILGLGVNGHIAFNEPGTPPRAPARVVRLAPDTRARNFPAPGGAVATAGGAAHEGVAPAGVAPDAPTEALTLGLAEIMDAREILLLVTGEAKREALHAACFGPVTPAVPASALQYHLSVTIYADEAAAGM
jgi:glucosamine-6-phosphate deaminase